MEMVIIGLKNPQDTMVKRKKCMIYPNDITKIWWDVIISAILCISCFCTPLDLALPKLF